MPRRRWLYDIPDFVSFPLHVNFEPGSTLLYVDNEHILHNRYPTDVIQTFYLISPDLTSWKNTVYGTDGTWTIESGLAGGGSNGTPLGLVLKSGDGTEHTLRVTNGGIIELDY